MKTKLTNEELYEKMPSVSILKSKWEKRLGRELEVICGNCNMSLGETGINEKEIKFMLPSYSFSSVSDMFESIADKAEWNGIAVPYLFICDSCIEEAGELLRMRREKGL